MRKCINAIDISIIIPIFNSKKFLNTCLKSITKQSLKNIEIICIDDGSIDNSSKILREFQKKDNRLIIIHRKNKGAGTARNHGIKISKGKFISFMDSDDLYPNKFTLELMFDSAIKNNALICGGGLISLEFENNKIKSKNIVTSFDKNEFILFSKYQYDYFFQRFIYNRNFIKKNKLYFPNYLRYEDPPFFIKSMIKAKYFYSLKNITYYKAIYKKKLVLKEKAVIDMFKGIKACLDISKSNNLYKLYYIILKRLNEKFFINIIKNYIEKKKYKF